MYCLTYAILYHTLPVTKTLVTAGKLQPRRKTPIHRTSPRPAGRKPIPQRPRGNARRIPTARRRGSLYGPASETVRYPVRSKIHAISKRHDESCDCDRGGSDWSGKHPCLPAVANRFSLHIPSTRKFPRTVTLGQSRDRGKQGCSPLQSATASRRNIPQPF